MHRAKPSRASSRAPDLLSCPGGGGGAAPQTGLLLYWFSRQEHSWRRHVHSVQPEILDTFSDVKLAVHFFDGNQSSAQAVIRRGHFCILRIEYNPKCKEIELDTADPDLAHLLIPAPFSRSTQYPVPSLLFQPKLVCTTFGHLADRMKNSCNYFMVKCQYGDKSANGVSRLAAGPVFSMGGKVTGILVRDNSSWVDMSYPGEKPSWVDEGFHFKICMLARQFQHIL